jgi:hypothetical protein
LIQEILPRLGQKYQIDWETVYKSREEYQSDEYKASGLPPAPAVIVGDELIHQGPGVSEEKLETAIKRHLGLP